MIISASRRTDIPSYYSNWFFNRLKEGFVHVRNPRNFKQVRRIELAPDMLDGIVFWTKNPMPILDRLSELQDYMCIFQFTITPYGKDIEPNVPPKNTDTLMAFKKLSKIIGADKIIWRYDPILINTKYTADYHVQAFEKIAKELHRYTRKVTISFIDTGYKAVKSNINKLSLTEFSVNTKKNLGAALASVAHFYDLSIDACAEKMDLHEHGIQSASCIDGKLFEKLLGRNINTKQDKNQRPKCGCISSIDIGVYNTCLNGCLYCYANYIQTTAMGNHAKHNPESSFLIEP